MEMKKSPQWSTRQLKRKTGVDQKKLQEVFQGITNLIDEDTMKKVESQLSLKNVTNVTEDKILDTIQHQMRKINDEIQHIKTKDKKNKIKINVK
jgi:hypothetical protein